MSQLNPAASSFVPALCELIPKNTNSLTLHLPRLPCSGNTMEQMEFEQHKLSKRLEWGWSERDRARRDEVVRSPVHPMQAFSGYVAPPMLGQCFAAAPAQQQNYLGFGYQLPAVFPPSQPQNSRPAPIEPSLMAQGEYQPDATVPRGPRRMTDPRDYPGRVDRSGTTIYSASLNNAGYQGYIINSSADSRPTNKGGRRKQNKNRRRESVEHQHPNASNFRFATAQSQAATNTHNAMPRPHPPQPSSSEDLFFGPAPSSSPITTYTLPGAPTTRSGLQADLPRPRYNPLAGVDNVVARGIEVPGQSMTLGNLTQQSLGNELDFQARVSAAGARGEVTFMDGGRFGDELETVNEILQMQRLAEQGARSPGNGWNEQQYKGRERRDSYTEELQRIQRQAEGRGQTRRKSNANDFVAMAGDAAANTRVKAWDMREWKIAGERRWDERGFKVMAQRRTRSDGGEEK